MRMKTEERFWFTIALIALFLLGALLLQSLQEVRAIRRLELQSSSLPGVHESRLVFRQTKAQLERMLEAINGYLAALDDATIGPEGRKQVQELMSPKPSKGD